MKRISKPGSRSGARKPSSFAISLVFVHMVLLCLDGQLAWSRQADTATSGRGKPVQNGFWAPVKDMRLGPFSLALSGQLRMRYESSDGFTLKGYQPGAADELLLERLRMEVALRFLDKPRLFLQLQDAHAFLTTFDDGDFPKSNPIENTLDIRQLYLEWLHIGETPLGFKVGRQQISYGDQRVFGPGNWGNTGRFAWDAAMFKIDADRFWMDLWIGKFLQYKSAIWPDRSVSDFLTFVTYTGIKNLPVNLELFYVNTRDDRAVLAGETGNGNVRSQSVGVQGTWQEQNSMDAGVTFVAQFGRYAADRIRAYGANAKWGTAISAPGRPRLGIQFTYGSGDRDPADGIHETFDGVFGGRDIQFYGYLNLFFWANLRDYQFDLSVWPCEDAVIQFEYHHFTLDKARDAWYTTSLVPYRRDRAGHSGLSLGDELDMRATWNLRGHMELMGGYGVFFPGSFVSQTGASTRAHWFFAQAAYSW